MVLAWEKQPSAGAIVSTHILDSTFCALSNIGAGSRDVLASIASRRCAREFIEREVLAGLPDWAPVLNPILMALLVPPRPLGWIWVSDVLHHQRLRSFANGGRKCPILAKPSFSPLKAAASNAAFGEQESLVHQS